MSVATPILFPYEPDQFWEIMRTLIREELIKLDKPAIEASLQVTGMTYKPLLKIAEVCSLFQVSRPTIYDWIKHGKLKPYRVRKSVYFLWNDIQQLLPV